ncbi:MAG: YibE/F family protein [Turicibacter sp.]|nr:YibE/F family protein [Turicibacter sp.]
MEMRLKLTKGKEAAVSKNSLFFTVTTLVMAAMVWFGMNSSIDFGRNPIDGVTFPTARVLEVLADQTVTDESGIRMGRQDLLMEIMSGSNRGNIVEVQNILIMGHSVFAEVGQRLVIYYELDEFTGAYFATVHSHERATAIYVIVLLFIGLMVSIFGKSGLRSAFGLVFTFITIIFLLLPLIVLGAPPALTTLILSFVMTGVSLISVMGFEKKTWVSILGTSVGIGAYALFYVLISDALVISGYNTPEVVNLAVIGFNTHMGVSELLFCAILIASLGAIMDVAVSIASVTAELSAKNPAAGFRELFHSGMKIGRDLIGSSSNTLILAFTGSFLVPLILFRTSNNDYNMLINRTDIGIEVLRAISASASMVLCAPATAVIGSHFHAAKPVLKTRKQ